MPPKIQQPKPARPSWGWGVGVAMLALLVGGALWFLLRPSPARHRKTVAVQVPEDDAVAANEPVVPTLPAQAPAASVDPQQLVQNEALRTWALWAQAAASSEGPDVPLDASTKQPTAEDQPLETIPSPEILPDGGAPFREYIQRRMNDDLMPLATACYDAARVANPELSGQVLIAFRIVPTASGASVVQSARVMDQGSTIKDPEFWRCVTDSVESLPFGPPSKGFGESSIQYPLTFAPGTSDGR